MRSIFRLQYTLPLVLGVLVVGLSLAGPWIAPHDPLFPAGDPFLPPGKGFLLGTDSIGRDLFSRILYGLQTTLAATAIVITVGALIGSIVGLVAAIRGGWVDQVLMRTVDAFLAMPAPILAIAVVAALGASLQNTVLALIVVWWPLYARLARGEAKAFLATPAAEAARINRIGLVRLAVRHIAPGLLPHTIVAATFDFGLMILMLAGLSFLGLGSASPAPELGAMSARNLDYLLQFWWAPVMPGLAIFMLSYIAYVFGDAVRNLVAAK